MSKSLRTREKSSRSRGGQDIEHRIRAVVRHIHEHAHERLTVAGLSRIANWSVYHFHRRFRAAMGVSVQQYLLAARLKRAAYRLAFRRWLRVIDIALDAGYDSSEAFTHAFKRIAGIPPSRLRGSPQEPFGRVLVGRTPMRGMLSMKPEFNSSDVQIVNFQETKVAALEHRGPHAQEIESIQRFIAWRRENRLSPAIAATYNIIYNDPDDVPAESYAIDICCAVKRDVEPNGYGVVTKPLPGGRYAVLRHVGTPDDNGVAAKFLALQWLPASGETFRDTPVFFHRVKMFPDVPETQAVTDVYLPLV